MPVAIIHPSFAAGELSPYLYGRVDLAKFQVGARTLLNFFVHAQGGASNRPGTQFCGEVDDSDVRHRLIPFEFRASPSGQNYILVFGDFTLQVAMDGGFVESSPGVRFTLATPYAYTDLPLLKYVQSADVMTLTHPDYAVRQLSRSGHAAWTLAPVTFQPSTPTPTGLAAVAPGSTGLIQVTAISDATGEESLPTSGVGATSNTVGSWTWTAVPGSTNYNVYKLKGSIYGFVAQVQTTAWTDDSIGPDISVTAPGTRRPFGFGVLSAITVTAGGSNYSSPAGAVIDGGKTITTVSFGLTGSAISSATLASTTMQASANAYVQITDGVGTGAVLAPQWTDDGSGNGTSYISGVTVVAGGAGYATHPEVHSYYAGVVDFGGYVFTATAVAGVITTAGVSVRGTGAWNIADQGLLTVSATDVAGAGATFDLTIAADGGTGNPGCSTYYQQRQAYGNTTQMPQSLWFTCVGAFANMNVSTPTKESDAITRTLTGRQVNEIRHLIPVGTSMLIMTSGAEWRCWPGPNSSALTPAACFTLPQTAHGCNHVPPIQAGNDVLFIQEKGSRVRALRFDAIQDQYQSFDMSILSSHLIYDTSGTHAIEEWAFAQEPEQIVWAVTTGTSAAGSLLGFTYMREHDVYAWHRHSSDGAVFESVATIPEADDDGNLTDAVYFIVRRSLVDHESFVEKRFLERMKQRTWATTSDMWFLDCAVQYRGAPVSTVSGLDHLEDQTVYALCNGSVVGPLTVSSGAVTLDGSYTVATVGFPFEAELATLNLEIQGPGGTSQGQPKRISQVTVRVKDARGVSIGIEQEVPAGSATGTAETTEIKQRWSEFLGTPMEPFSGDLQVQIAPEWTKGGRLVIKQTYPLPCTILAIIPETLTGD